MLEALETLDLSHNHIKKLHSVDLQSISKASVVHINLVGTQLAHLNFSRIENQILNNPAKRPKIILNIQNNFVTCGCDIYDYVRYVQGKMNETVYRMLTVNDQNVTCASPPRLAHRQVSKLSLNKILCVSNAPSTALAPMIRKIPRDCECTRYMDICPPNCCCCFAIHIGELLVNCSRAGYTEFPDLTVKKEFKTIVLYMEHNNITELPKNDKENYKLVTEIHVEHNQVATFNSSNLLPNLQSINLTHNQLQSIDKSLLVQLNSSNLSVSLAHNPWMCDCKLKDLRSFIAKVSKCLDYSLMQCSDQQIFSRTNLCDDTWIASIKLFAVVGLGALLILAIGCIFYLQYHEEIKVWMFAHNILAGWVNEQSLDHNKKYDAFVSYSEEDAKYANILMKTLESGPEPYKLCVHDRDWAPGDWVMDQVSRY
jgi:protein toll